MDTQTDGGGLKMRGVVAAAVLCALIALPARVTASAGWEISVGPSTISQGEPAAVGVRVTNVSISRGIRCVVLSIPSAFTVFGAAPTATTVAASWAASVSPAPDGGTSVAFYILDDLYKLKEGDWLEASVSVRGDQAGSFGWLATAFHSSSCAAEQIPDSLMPFVTVVASTQAPTPAAPPAPPPSGAPEPEVTAPPSGAAAGPTSGNTPRPDAGPGAEPADEDEDEDEGPAAGPSSSPGETTGGAGASPSTPGERSGPGDDASEDAAVRSEGTGIVVAGVSGDFRGGSRGGLVAPAGLSALTVLGDDYVWFVPGVAVGVPGLLLIIIVGVQAIGGALWIPVTRRLLGRERSRFAGGERVWWTS